MAVTGVGVVYPEVAAATRLFCRARRVLAVKGLGIWCRHPCNHRVRPSCFRLVSMGSTRPSLLP